MTTIALDMKLGLTVLSEIIVENRGDEEIIAACRLVVEKFKEQIAKGTTDVKSQIPTTRAFALTRTRLMLHLLCDVERHSGTPDEGNLIKYGKILTIVEEKIKELQEEGKRGIN